MGDFDQARAALDAAEETQRLARNLCNSANETEQNYWRWRLGVYLCGWGREQYHPAYDQFERREGRGPRADYSEVT